MAKQVIVTSNNTVQVSVEPTPNVEVTISRTAVGTIANVPTANYANFAGNVVNAAQPNITSVGTLTNLNVSNTITTNNLVVNGNFQIGNLVANTANYANFAGNANVANSAIVANSANSVAGANVTGTVANATYAANAGFATTAGSANTANSATVAASANSVTLANVSGAGNIASINLDGSTSNVLYGNGVFAPAAGGNTANANYANFAGTAFSVSGSNVSGAVANATFADDAGNANIANIAYSVSGANVSGAVANATFADDAGNANIANIAYSVAAANVSGLGNIATINLDGNASNLLDGTGNFVAIPTVSANANYANFAGTVLTNAQPNITSVGNLSALTVTGNITSNTISWSNSLSYNGSGTSDKILVQSDLPGGTAVRNLPMRAGNITNASASNTAAGGMLVQGGAAVSTDTGNAFIARGGVMVMFGGQAQSANGAAFGGGVQLSSGTTNSNAANATAGALNLLGGSATALNGNAITNSSSIGFAVANATNGNATGGTLNIGGANARTITSGNASGGTVSITSGPARSENGNATSGNINLTTAGAVANVTTGTATVGSININCGTANGITANVFGNINIGTTGGLNSINIGQSLTSVIVPGTLSANNANITSNLSANNANITSNLSANIVNATYLYGDGSNISNISGGTPNSIQNGNSIVNFSGPDGDLLISTNNVTNGIQVTGRQLILNGIGEQPPGNGVYSGLTITNGGLSLSQDNIGGGLATFAFTMYENTNSFLNPYTFYRARGNASSPSAVANGDVISSQQYYCYADSGNTYSGLGSFSVNVNTNDGAGNVSSSISINTQNNNDGSAINLSTDIINLQGNSQVNITALDTTLTGNLSAPYSNVANTQLNRYQETTFAIGNVSGTITPDFNNGSIQSMTLTGNITLNSLGNAVAGRSMTLILTQDGTGSKTLTSSMLFAGASKTLSTAAAAIDVISLFYDGTTYYASLSKGYA